MIPRLTRVAAIARRDLEREVRGRRGLVLGATTLLLLVPTATIQVDLPERDEMRRVTVVGKVPQEVLDQPMVRKVKGHGHMRFRERDDGKLQVSAQVIPKRVREALDGPEPALELLNPLPEPLYPGRTLLFALISASVLTGAVSESIGGERSRRTLQALLAAAVTRLEIVVGKWLAWTGYGAVAAFLAAGAALLLGRVEAGWWLLPMPTVAAATVALALYLSRHATDVVGGAAVSLRYLPAVISLLGLVAWYYGQDDPLLGAAVPLGGALLAAGATWTGALPAVVATASTMAMSLLLVWLSARGLERPAPPRDSLWNRARQAGTTTAIAAASWWAATASPLLWEAAGNASLTRDLAPAAGIRAGIVVLLILTAVRAGRVLDPLEDIGLKAPPRAAWLWAAALGVVLALTTQAGMLLPTPDSPLLAAARPRMAAALQPSWTGPGTLVLAVLAQEWIFRGWLQRWAGPLVSTAASVIVLAPLDPVHGILVGGSLAALTRLSYGSVWPAVGARLSWAAAALFLPGLPGPIALVFGLLALLGLVTWVRRAPQSLA
jgi:hypothetical protein